MEKKHTKKITDKIQEISPSTVNCVGPPWFKPPKPAVSVLESRCKLSDYIIRQQLREIAEKIDDGGEINKRSMIWGERETNFGGQFFAKKFPRTNRLPSFFECTLTKLPPSINAGGQAFYVVKGAMQTR